ncbi:MAG: flagellar protein FlgN, partial [Clostridia bacterium]
AKDKTEVIVAGRIAELESLVKLEQALVVQIGRLEQQREEAVDVIADQLKLDKQNITVFNLMQHLDKSQQEKLRDFEKNMTKILEELKNRNDLNAKLIKQSLEYIEFSMNLLTDASVPGNAYESKGTTRETRGTRNFFDIKL